MIKRVYQKRNKFKAVKQMFNGRQYHSKKEAAFAQELHLRKLAGEITEIIPQYPLRIYVNGKKICNYFMNYKLQNKKRSDTNSIKLDCPLFIDLPRKIKKHRRVYINLNAYRNLHYQINNQVKKEYLKKVKGQLEGISIKTPVEITYRVFKKNKRILDKMNVVSVTSKYLFDAITQLGCWEDDSDTHVKKETLLPTKIDPINPRVEVSIKSI